MTEKRVLTVVTLLLALATASVLLYYKYVRVEVLKAKLQVASTAGFIAHFTEHLCEFDGSPTELVSHRKIAVRSNRDRSETVEKKTKDGRAFSITRVTFNTGKIVELRNHIKTSTTKYTPKYEFLRSEVTRTRDPRKDCRTSVSGGEPLLEEELLGVEDVHGISAVGLRSDGGNRRITSWFAPSMGCLAVKRLIEFHAQGVPFGPITSGSELAMEDIVFGEPPEKLFATPKDYYELRPSEALKRHFKFLGRRPSPRELKRFGQVGCILRAAPSVALRQL